jgi:cupin fold WbuC family metalloprotein
MDIQTIDKNLLSDLHQKAVANERKRMNFDLRTSALDQSQRMLNALEPGTQVPVHRHMETAETTICIEGYLEVVLYAEASGQDEREPVFARSRSLQNGNRSSSRSEPSCRYRNRRRS